MNSETGKLVRQTEIDKMSDEEKKKYFYIQKGMLLSQIKELSRSEKKRAEYMAEVERKRKEGVNK